MASALITTPTQLIAGDAFAASLSAADYPATAGWAATLYLVGPATRYTVAGSANGADFAFAATAAATASYAAGTYSVRVTVALGANRYTLDGKTLPILPDPAGAGTLAGAYVTGWRKIYADLVAAYQAHITGGKSLISEYLIGTRRVYFHGPADVLKAISNAKIEAMREQAAEDAAAGLPSRSRFVTRM